MVSGPRFHSICPFSTVLLIATKRYLNFLYFVDLTKSEKKSFKLFFVLQGKTTGQDLLDNIYKYLNLLETAYFGLRYQDNSNQTV